MKKTLLKYLSVAALAFAVSSTASAALINGAITFAGGSATYDTGNVGTADAVTSWGTLQDPMKVGSVTGDFTASVSVGDLITIIAPWSFDSGAVAGFWNVGGFTFDLISSSVLFQTTLNNGGVLVQGNGILKKAGYEDTAASWSFSSQGPGAGTKFSFSASSAATQVPDGGTTAALLGAALVGLSLLARRRAA